MRRVMLIGLDCVPPSLAFERYRSEMPCLSALMERGVRARLHSTFPPITVPAWTSMVSGRDPGELGLYGFRQRIAGSYGLSLVQSGDLRAPRVWDVLGARGLYCSVLFVPPSYPVREVDGTLASCFLTPEDADSWTYPAPFGGELEARFGRYIPDVSIHKRPREDVLEDLLKMTRQHFAMALHTWKTREPDFMMFVEIGPDRLHHALFQTFADPQADFGLRYYRELDACLKTLVEEADDSTSVIVASDHGARPLGGVFRINQWLIREGYLVLREHVREGEAQPLCEEHIDFSRTRAWAEGGYYARVMFNVKGREPQGIVDVEDLARERAILRDKLIAIRGPGGEPWKNRVHAPEDLYRAVNGLAPDLLAVFDDLSIRPIATIGVAALYGDHDDRGPDGANHDWHGIFVAAGAGVSARGDLGECAIYDVGATVLGLFGVPLPEGWLGQDRSHV